MKIFTNHKTISIHYAALLISAAFLFAVITFLSGCAVETPKAYFKIPNTGYSAYVYGGAGISPDINTLGK